MGTMVVRTGPPQRVQRAADGTIRRVNPIDEDWRIPENHMVFTVSDVSRKKLNYRGAPESGKRRRVGVVADAFSNWKGRALYDTQAIGLADGTRVDTIGQDFEVKFAGVAWDGCKPQPAKRNPDANGRVALTPNGIVSIYVDTRYLFRDNVQVFDVLEWLPIGSRMSWKEYGPNFETCVVRKFSMANYELRVLEPGMTVTQTTMSSMGPADNNTFEKAVETEAKDAMGKTEWGTYFGVMDSMGLEPFGATGNLSDEEWSKLDRGLEAASSVVKRQMSAAGMHEHDAEWLSTYSRVLDSGADSSAIFPRDAGGIHKTVNKGLLAKMKKAGVVTKNDHKTYDVNVAALANLSTGDRMAAVAALKDHAGTGVSGTVFAHQTEAVMDTFGCIDPEKEMSTHTWDGLHRIARTMDSKTKSAMHVHSVDAVRTIVSNAAIGEDGKKRLSFAEKKDLKKHLGVLNTSSAMFAGIHKLVRQPVTQIRVVPSAAKVKDEQVEAGAQKLTEFAGEYDKLCTAAGVRQPVGGPLNIVESTKRILDSYNDTLCGLEETSEPMAETPVDLLVRTQRGESISPEDTSRVRGIYTAARAKGVPLQGIEHGLSVLSSVTSDSDVAAWVAKSSGFISSLNASAQNTKSAFRQATMAHASAVAQSVYSEVLYNAVVKYLRDNPRKAGDFAGYLPTALRMAIGSWSDVGKMEDTKSLSRTINVTVAAAEAACTTGRTDGIDFGSWETEPAVLSEFLAKDNIMSCVYAPAVELDADTWMAPGQNLVTLLTNSAVYGKLASRCIAAGNRNALERLHEYMTGHSLTDDYAFLVKLDKEGTIDDATAKLTAELNKIGVTANVTAHGADSAAELTLFEVPISPIGFEEMCKLHTATAGKDLSFRLCGRGFLKKIKAIQQVEKKVRDGMSAEFKKRVAQNVDPDGMEILETIADNLHQNAAFSGATFFSEMRACLSNNMYCVDHPLTLAFLHASPKGENVSINDAATIFKVDSYRNGNNAVRMTSMLRQWNGSASTCVFLSSIPNSAAVSIFEAATKHSIHTMSRIPSAAQVAVCLGTAAAVLPSAENAKFQKTAAESMTASRGHMIAGIRSAVQTDLGENALIKNVAAKKTGSLFLPDAMASTMETAEPHLVIGGAPVAVADDRVIVKNPFARRFATLLEIRRNEIRVQLDMALSTPPVAHHVT